MLECCAPSAGNLPVSVRRGCPGKGDVSIVPAEEGELADFESREKHYQLTPDGCAEIPVAPKGVASTPPTTLSELWKDAILEHGKQVALRWEDPASHDRELMGITWEEVYDQVCTCARAILNYNLPESGSVALLGFNSPQWFTAFHAGILAGGNSVGVFASLTFEAISHIIKHCKAKLLFVDGITQLEKFKNASTSAAPYLAAFVVWGPEKELKEYIKEHQKDYCALLLCWSEFLKKGDAESPNATGKNLEVQLQSRMEKSRPGDVAGLVYTSGTCGTPKACMLTHDNYIFSARSLFQRIKPPQLVDTTQVNQAPKEKEQLVSFVPLSHVSAQLADLIFPLVYTAATSTSVCVTFARRDWAKGSFIDTLRLVRPTFFFGIPRVYEIMYEQIMDETRQSGLCSKAMLSWARGIGGKKSAAFMKGKRFTPLGYNLAAAAVFSGLHDRLGLDKCTDSCYVGAAPCSDEIIDFFGSIGITLRDIFGMSETTACGLCIPRNIGMRGSCGYPCDGVEVMIKHDPDRDQPGEGELCFRGRNVFLGYMKDEKSTKESLTDEGWFLSGDVATSDERGMVTITGRIKEILITSGGEKIPPIPIEDWFKHHCPPISNCMVVGNRLKFLSIFFTLRTTTDPHGEDVSHKLVEGAKGFGGSTAATVVEAKGDQKFQAAIQAFVDRYNKEEAPSSAHKIKKWVILSDDFTVKGGDLTPTLKLKRQAVLDKHHPTLTQLYD